MGSRRGQSSMDMSDMDLHDAQLGRVIELTVSDDILMGIKYVVIGNGVSTSHV